MGWGTSRCSLPDPRAVTQTTNCSKVSLERAQLEKSRPHGPCGGKGAGLQLRVFHSLNWYPDLAWAVSPLCSPLPEIWDSFGAGPSLTDAEGDIGAVSVTMPRAIPDAAAASRAQSTQPGWCFSPSASEASQGLLRWAETIFCENHFASRVLWTVTTCHYGPHLLFVYIAACTIKGIDM